MTIEEAVRTFGQACDWAEGSIVVATEKLKRYRPGERMEWRDAAFGFGIPMRDATGLLVYLTAHGFLKEVPFARCFACLSTLGGDKELERQYFTHTWDKYLHQKCRFCGAELSPNWDFDAEYEVAEETHSSDGS